MSRKRILITGAVGFLGSHLSDRFINEGYYVIAMDNLITGDIQNIAHLRSDPNHYLYWLMQFEEENIILLKII